MKWPVLLLAMVLTSVSFSLGQVQWERSIENPVVPYWSGQSSDPNWLRYAIEPSVLFDEATGIYRMWYCSYTRNGGALCISHAISTDGVHWFPYAKNPVLSPSASGFDRSAIWGAEVIFKGDRYLMYYSGGDGTNISIGVAKSEDGITWSKDGANPIVPVGSTGSWDASMATYPRVIHDGTKYVMLYNGRNGSISSTGLATSLDGFVWTKHGGNPVITAGISGSWDSDMAVPAALARHNGRYVALYVGGAGWGAPTSLGLATSSDGITWAKYGNNPVMTPGPGWENFQLGGGSLRYFGDRFHLWYCAKNSGSGGWQVGYATSRHVTQPELGTGVAHRAGFALYPVYPNPFNPSTTISFDLSEETHVSLTIIDILGRVVATLVDERRGAGRHSLLWKSDHMATGIYWCRISAGSFSEIQQLVLTR